MLPTHTQIHIDIRSIKSTWPLFHTSTTCSAKQAILYLTLTKSTPAKLTACYASELVRRLRDLVEILWHSRNHLPLWSQSMHHHLEWNQHLNPMIHLEWILNLNPRIRVQLHHLLELLYWKHRHHPSCRPSCRTRHRRSWAGGHSRHNISLLRDDNKDDWVLCRTRSKAILHLLLNLLLKMTRRQWYLRRTHHQRSARLLFRRQRRSTRNISMLRQR